MRIPRPRTVAPLALAGALLLGLAACGGTDDADPSPPVPASSGAPHDDHAHDTAADAPSGQHTEADVRFAQSMIPHHEQAIVMSDIVLGKEGIPPEVAGLAERIKAAQGPEIEQMDAWLAEWGAPRGGDATGGHGDDGHGDGGHEGHGDGAPMEGMLSEEQLGALRAAPGPEAARLFLEGMIAHHEGAVTMAESEIADGSHPDAVRLAHDIVATQRTEIDEMRAML